MEKDQPDCFSPQLSLRDLMAAAVLPALVSESMREERVHAMLAMNTARDAYVMADAMLEARKK